VRYEARLRYAYCEIEILKRIDDAKRKMGRVMQIAAFSLAEVTYAVGGDIGFQVQESVKQAKFRIRTKQENVSGVFLPQFEGFQKEEINDFGLTGLGKGGQQVARSRETYVRAVETLVELASLQTAFMILDEVIKVVNRRVNAIEHVIIPRTENTIKCESVLLQLPTILTTGRHQLRTRRIGSRRVLSTQEGLEQETTRPSSSR
jgi:H(+)-transporting ATP synthase subunit D